MHQAYQPVTRDPSRWQRERIIPTFASNARGVTLAHDSAISTAVMGTFGLEQLKMHWTGKICRWFIFFLPTTPPVTAPTAHPLNTDPCAQGHGAMELTQVLLVALHLSKVLYSDNGPSRLAGPLSIYHFIRISSFSTRQTGAEQVR